MDVAHLRPILPLPNSPQSRQERTARRLFVHPLFLLSLASLLSSGCKRFQHEEHDHVYVAARQVYLHDRVAAVSNCVGLVTNGEALEVIEKGKRFVKVKTPKGEIGWLEDHAIIDSKLYEQFQDLAKTHAQDPVVAKGELRDDLYLHVKPGRESPHFLLIPGNTKVALLERGAVEKGAVAGMPMIGKVPKLAVTPKVAAAQAASGTNPATAKVQSGAAKNPDSPSAQIPGPIPAAPPPMEDWWLVRDVQGHTGWLLASRLDVDVPDEVASYSEGQRMVAAYPIAKVTDYGAGREHKSTEGKSGRLKSAPKDSEAVAHEDADSSQSKEVTEYVTVLTPPQGGLPYDFDQVRVFVWSLNHHRYETGFRLHGIHGYLPVTLSQETVNGQTFPTFSFKIASGTNVTVDSETGVTRPVDPRTLSFRLEGNMIRRTGEDLAPIVLTHEAPEASKKKLVKKRH